MVILTAMTNIPLVTLAVLGLNVYLHIFPAAPLNEVCLSLRHVYRNGEWRRLLLSPLHHADDRHLCLNMLSLLLNGIWLERRLSGAWFLYLLSVFFLLEGPVLLLLEAVLTTLNDLSLLVGFRADGCGVGFSGVLFALTVVTDHSITFFILAEEVIIQVLVHRVFFSASLVGHLAGVLVGLLYTVGPLETIMKTCAGPLM